MKKIILECFTSNAGIHELFPIGPAKKFIPQWFKDLSPTQKKTNEYEIVHDIATFKRCDGFTKLYQNGFILPLWQDFIIETTKEGRYRWTVPEDIREEHGGGTIDHHDPQQMGFRFSDYVHVKLVAPWHLREKTGVNFYYHANTWGIDEHWDDVIIVPGILNFKDQHGGHINMFIKKERRVEFAANTPLIQCVPLSEAQLEIKNILVTDQEYKHLMQTHYAFSFTGLYKKRVKLKK